MLKNCSLLKRLPFNSWQLLCGKNFSLPFTPRQVLLFFIGFSFAVTALDIAMAHSQNNFFPKYEWIPIFHALIAAIIIFSHLFKPNNKFIINLYRLTIFAGLLVGIVGTYFHIFGNISVKE